MVESYKNSGTVSQLGLDVDTVKIQVISITTKIPHGSLLQPYPLPSQPTLSLISNNQ